jgi:signal transduction histidine kinase
MFTLQTSSDKRDILVNVEVSLRRPSNDQPCVPPEPSDDEPHPVNPDEPVTIYIFVSVKDSGPGLKPEDLALLFKRHVRYVYNIYYSP